MVSLFVMGAPALLGQEKQVSTSFSVNPAITTSQFGGDATTTMQMLPTEELIRGEASRAQFRFGPLKLQPVVVIGPAGYTNNFYGESDQAREGDYTVTAGAGARAWVLPNRRFAIRASLIPTYTWYLKHNERSALTGVYDLTAFLFLGSVTLSMTGASTSGNVDLSSEVQQPVKQSLLGGSVLAEWKLGGRMSLVGGVSLMQRSYGGNGLTPTELEQLQSLDGTDTIWSIGIRRRVGTRMTIGLSYEEGHFAYVNSGSLRDATSQGVLGSAFLDRGRLRINMKLGYREYRPSGNSSFPSTSGLSGGGGLTYQVGRVVWVGLEGVDGTIPSLHGTNAVFLEERIGPTIGLTYSRVGVGVSAQIGRNRYLVDETLSDGSIGTRQDDMRSVSGNISFPVFRSASVTAKAEWSDARSNVAGASRTTFQIGASLRFGDSNLRFVEFR
jgi:hypothetical protein